MFKKLSIYITLIILVVILIGQYLDYPIVGSVKNIVSAIIGSNTSSVAVLGTEDTIELTDAKVKEAIAKEKDILILDVRPRLEYSWAHIPGTVNVPFQELGTEVGKLEKGRKTIVVSLDGKVSMEVVTFLKENGFSKVYNLSGGMKNWTGEIVK